MLLSHANQHNPPWGDDKPHPAERTEPAVLPETAADNARQLQTVRQLQAGEQACASLLVLGPALSKPRPPTATSRSHPSALSSPSHAAGSPPRPGTTPPEPPPAQGTDRTPAYADPRTLGCFTQPTTSVRPFQPHQKSEEKKRTRTKRRIRQTHTRPRKKTSTRKARRQATPSSC